VGVLKEREGPPSVPEGGVGNLCLKSSNMLLCSLRFNPYTHTHTHTHTHTRTSVIARGNKTTEEVGDNR
jgi:hypothetical protein